MGGTYKLYVEKLNVVCLERRTPPQLDTHQSNVSSSTLVFIRRLDIWYSRAYVEE